MWHIIYPKGLEHLTGTKTRIDTFEKEEYCVHELARRMPTYRELGFELEDFIILQGGDLRVYEASYYQGVKTSTGKKLKPVEI